MQIKVCFILLLFSFSLYSQSKNIAVIKHTDNDFVIPKDAKVVFRGIPNELFIDVPNCKSFTAIGDGLSLLSKNLYNLNPGAGSEVIITINIVLKNNKKVVEKYVYEIRNVKTQIAYLNYYEDSYLKLQKQKLLDAQISIKIPDKNLDFQFDVKGFELKVEGKNTIEVVGNKINKEVFNRITNRLQKGDKILISNIKFLCRNIKNIYICKTNSIIIEIM